MYYYSKKSGSKIIHKTDCFCIQNTDINDLGWFETLSEAYSQGYCFCGHCNPLFKPYNKELDEMMEYCRKNGLSFWRSSRFISICSTRSEWRIALDKNDRIVLYHKNDFKTDRDHLSEIKGYHFQGDVRHDSIVKYMEYIVDHDYFRMLNPVYAPRKKEITPPQKGSKRYKSAQKRFKKFERKREIRNVLNLIDSLSAPSPSMAM